MDCYRGRLLVRLANEKNNEKGISKTNTSEININSAATTTGSGSSSINNDSESRDDFSSDDLTKDKTWEIAESVENDDFIDEQEAVVLNENQSFVIEHEELVLNENQNFVIEHEELVLNENQNFVNEHEELDEVDEEVLSKPQKSRKRKRNFQQWKSNLRKTLKNSGKSYVTKTGKIIPEKKMKHIFYTEHSCKFNCSAITEPERQQIFEKFWDLSDLNLQRAYISNCVSNVIPKYRYIRQGSKRIGMNLAYSFPNSSGDKIRVCKKYFMTTLDVGDRFIRTAVAKMSNLEGELRGKNIMHFRIDTLIHEKIKEHINSFPTIESHYLRNQTERVYISGDLTLAEMYRLYVAKCETENITPAKECTYRNVFNTEFNIGFFVPKKDQCAFCEKYKNCNNDEINALQEALEKHRNEIKKCRTQKEIDKNIAIDDPENFTTICYDLQAVLSTPHSHISNFFYTRKFASYNFTLFNLASKRGYCYLWNEDQGYRGANEIGTCVYDFLINNCINKSVIFYSDNCMGQQKNNFIACMYIYVAENYNVKSITHNFLIVGHTQNEGDCMHSVIEKSVKRTIKSGPIYSPLQWRITLQNAKKNGPPYSVTELTFNDFLDLKNLSGEIGNRFNVNSQGEKVNWNDIKAIKIEKENPFTIYYKTSYDEPEFSKCIKTVAPTRKKQFKIPKEINKVFSQPPGISVEKKKDLVALCNEKLIPDMYQTFYRELKTK